MPEDTLTKAAREWDLATEALTEANKAAKAAAKVVGEAKAKVLALLDSREQKGVRIDDYSISRYELPFARIANKEAFKAWADADDEAWFEPEPRLRKGELDKVVRERIDNNQPLPPGVEVWLDDRISKTKKAKR